MLGALRIFFTGACIALALQGCELLTSNSTTTTTTTTTTTHTTTSVSSCPCLPPADGRTCTGLVPVYRLLQANVNHRYTTEQAVCCHWWTDGDSYEGVGFHAFASIDTLAHQRQRLLQCIRQPPTQDAEIRDWMPTLQDNCEEPILPDVSSHTLGFVATNHSTGTVPLYRFFNHVDQLVGDHFVSTNATESAYGYRREGVLAYVPEPTEWCMQTTGEQQEM